MQTRWFHLLIAAVTGIALGLSYGWLISPVEYIDVTPELLRADFRTDYVLMVAEAYRVEQDPELASRKLAILGSEAPAILTAQAYEYARQNAYNPDDLALLQELAVALQTWQPLPSTASP
ncbi:MAG: hypothetical protein Kow002_09450 [Anaerolineales bacterium]